MSSYARRVDNELGSVEREVGRLREVYTKEAVELLKADGLLPEEEQTLNN
jgi:hypothetical protein